MTRILYENGLFWVCAAEFGSGRFKPKNKGYEVYENGITHATRRAIIGFAGERGLKRAIAEADRLAGDARPPRRESADTSSSYFLFTNVAESLPDNPL